MSDVDIRGVCLALLLINYQLVFLCFESVDRQYCLYSYGQVWFLWSFNAT